MISPAVSAPLPAVTAHPAVAYKQPVAARPAPRALSRETESQENAPAQPADKGRQPRLTGAADKPAAAATPRQDGKQELSDFEQLVQDLTADEKPPKQPADGGKPAPPVLPETAASKGTAPEPPKEEVHNRTRTLPPALAKITLPEIPTLNVLVTAPVPQPPPSFLAIPGPAPDATETRAEEIASAAQPEAGQPAQRLQRDDTALEVHLRGVGATPVNAAPPREGKHQENSQGDPRPSPDTPPPAPPKLRPEPSTTLVAAPAHSVASAETPPAIAAPHPAENAFPPAPENPVRPHVPPGPPATERPAAPPVFMHEPTAAKPDTAQPLRSVSLEFAPDGAGDVRLRLSERAGEVHISLHSSDPSLSGRIHEGIHDLVGSLSTAGYDAEAWTPSQGRRQQGQPEDSPKKRRSDSSGAGSEVFGGILQQPLQEIS